MRVFTKIRQYLSDNINTKLEIVELKNTVEKIAKKQQGHDKNIELLFEYIDRLQEKESSFIPQKRKYIGFKIKGKENE